MAFGGWPRAALDFFAGLEADNSKRYWSAHREVYERGVRAPMLDLLEELEGEFGPSRLFRPYRDVRFSHDKSPYKTTIAATVGSRYVQLSADGLLAGAGLYHMEPDQLERYRTAVAATASGRRLAGVVEELHEAGIEIGAHDELKTAPRGYPKDHPRIELLRRRGIVAMKAWPAGRWLATPRAKERVVAVFRAAGPLVGWLESHVGPTAQPAARRRRR